jgi:Fe(3+) dicitrate transport protein
MKSWLNTIVVLLITFMSATAQKGGIVGKVTDGANNPVVGANILLKNTVRGVQTNSQGEFVIKSLKGGNYVLLVSSIGLKSIEKSFILLENETKQIDFSMEVDSYMLNDVKVIASRGVRGNEHLAEVEGFSINAGKKNEVIKLDNLNANLAMNNSRQVFSRTPGISVWENDGSGIQLGIASRGLSPNRSWEFNVRMNGYDITPDPMGYPEAYYTPPMEVVDRIEIVRGASSLQYGPQFGGLMNFVLRKPDISTRITVESQNTVGSNGLFSTFNYIGGTEGKLSYATYYQKRWGNGWRNNSYFNTDHAHAELSFAVSNKLKIGGELTYMTYESQQAGGVTDEQFAKDARQSSRARNWFSTPWLVPSINAEYIFSQNSKLSFKAFGTFSERNSVGFVKAITETDDLKNRQVDSDFYRNYGSELRFITDYKLFGKKNTLVSGLRFYDGNITRQQQGKGTAGNDVDFSIEGIYPRDLTFNNVNKAAFFENLFRFNERFLITTGLRYENISSTMQGRLGVVNGQNTNLEAITRTRSFVLFGVGAEFHVTPSSEFYSNLSQAYRPVLISDLTPPATTDIIDQNLKDATGYNFDFGYRGKVRNFFNFDVDYFYLNYDNRIGTITQIDDAGKKYQYRTNLGRSVSSGFEAYLEFDPMTAFFEKSRLGSLSIFASLALIDATYRDFKITSVGSDGKVIEGNLSGKRVENAPRKINRFGVTYAKKGFSATWQMSDIGEAYSDASNTEKANAAATTGLIPAYQVQDLSASFKFLKHYNIKSGINNLTDERYFTRRSGGYPGPGILPADGRTFYVAFGVKF